MSSAGVSQGTASGAHPSRCNERRMLYFTPRSSTTTRVRWLSMKLAVPLLSRRGLSARVVVGATTLPRLGPLSGDATSRGLKARAAVWERAASSDEYSYACFVLTHGTMSVSP